MKKIFAAGAVVALLACCSIAAASPLVTSNVPLDSRYYDYIDKLEGMGYIKDMPSGTKPYSRLDMAKWIASINPAGMPDYLKVYYDEMAADLAEEIAYVKGEKQRFESNVKLRSASVAFSYVDADHTTYDYRNNNYKHQDKSSIGQKINAHWQPLNKNNNGYRYGDGFNAVGKLNISGSINKDFALSLTPRFSYDKDEHGDASLEEGYVKTHLGVWGIEVGKQPLQWGGYGHKGAFVFSNNATPHTMVKLNLLEPHTFDNGFLKFLGKANVNVFYSQMEGNRRDQAEGFFPAGSDRWQKENDGLDLLGVRVDITPSDNFTFGLERVSMAKSLNKDWLFGENADADDQWNDIGGADFRFKLPGMQVYGAAYGEDQAGGLPCEYAYSAGLYFPQLSSDGRWDLRLEAAKTNEWWYSHGTFENGWTYKDDIMGASMGKDTLECSAIINHYMDNGDRIGFQYTNTDFDRHKTNNPRMQEFQINYAKKLKKDMYLDAMIGYAMVDNVGYVKNADDSTTMVGLGLRWEY